MTSAIWFLIGLWIGGAGGVFVMGFITCVGMIALMLIVTRVGPDGEGG